jgi:Pyruvate/2-oxoacid:ferredoxin oxidoreductase delta subunit
MGCAHHPSVPYDSEVDWLAGAVKRRAGKRADGSAKPSLVVPIGRSLEAWQKVVPGEQAIEMLSNARIIAMQGCECRENLAMCHAPVKVCLALDGVAESQIAAGVARCVSIDEAKEILCETEDAGLVHMVIHSGNWKPEAVCSCCVCCCQELNALLNFGHLDAVLKSDHIVVKVLDKCISCGACVQACPFSAHRLDADRVAYDSNKCFGCGLCVRVCPADSLKIVSRTALNSGRVLSPKSR